jgi:hypothetical protein
MPAPCRLLPDLARSVERVRSGFCDTEVDLERGAVDSSRLLRGVLFVGIGGLVKWQLSTEVDSSRYRRCRMRATGDASDCIGSAGG